MSIRFLVASLDWSGDAHWGYGFSELIDDKILDFNDDPNLKVLIDYEPFSTVPVPTEKENFGDVKAMFR